MILVTLAPFRTKPIRMDSVHPLLSIHLCRRTSTITSYHISLARSFRTHLSQLSSRFHCSFNSFPLAPALVLVRIIQDLGLPRVVEPQRSMYLKQSIINKVTVVWSHSRPSLRHSLTTMYTLMTPSKSGMCTTLVFLDRTVTSTFPLFFNPTLC